MKTLKQDWLIWLIIIVPFVFIAIYWDKFPDQIPTHFGMDGKPNGYSEKGQGLFLMSGINVLMYLLFLVLPKIDPSRANYALFSDKYRIIRLLLHIFLTFSFFLSALYALGWDFDISLFVLYGLLVLFLLLGNYIGTVRHNYFVGVRTPWTLSNEMVWTKTHRLTAKLWVFTSLITMAALPFVSDKDVFFGIYLAVITVIPIVYSYLLFRKIKGKS
jgi:uncharacterized membrane protein